MIAVDAVRSAHDQIVGAIVVVFVLAMIYRPTRIWAVGLACVGFLVAVAVESRSPGLVDGRP